MAYVIPYIYQVLTTVYGYGAVYAAAIATAIGVGAQILMNKVSQALGPKKPRQFQSITASYAGTDQPKRAIYGLVRVGGMDLHPPWSLNTDGSELHRAWVLAYHECDSFGDVYMDSLKITNSDITAVAGNANDGKVTSASYAFHDKIWIRRYRGTASQTVDFILNALIGSVAWTASKRGSGVCYAMVKQLYSTKAWTSVGQFSFEVYGARVYDPRLDSTNGGAGTQRYTDPTTWTWSANPALCAAHYMFALSFGPLIDTTRIDWTSLAAAATVCDTLVNIPGATTQARFTYNGLVYASDSFSGYEDVIRDFATAMVGRITFHDGKWFFAAGQFDTPSATINESDWVGALQPRFSDAKATRWNAVRPFFWDAANSYTHKSAFIRTNASYEVAFNNERLYRDVDFIGCTNKYEAQRKGELILRQGQNVVTITGRLRPAQAGIALGETVYVNFAAFSWSSKTFRVIAASDNMDGSLTVTLKEEQSTDWTDLAAVEYDTPSTSTVPTNVPPVPTVSGLAANPLDAAISFDWNVDSNIYHPITHYRLMEYSSKYPYENSAPVWEGQGIRKTVIPRSSDLKAFFWIEASVGSQVVIAPSTFGLLTAPLWLNRETINDPEFQVFSGQGSPWLFLSLGGSSLSFVESSQWATGQMVTAWAPDSLGTTTQIFPRAQGRPTSKQDQTYRVDIRWRRSNSIFPANSTASPNSMDPYIKFELFSSNSAAGTQDLAGTGPPGRTTIQVSANPGSRWYHSQGYVISAGSKNTDLPFYTPVISLGFRNGVIDIDRVSLTSVASTQTTSLMVTT